MASTERADAMLYFVQVDLGRLGLVWLERSDTSRKTLIRDLRSREIQDVTAILECNPVEHVCSDVTEELIHAAKWGDHTETPEQRARVNDESLERVSI